MKMVDLLTADPWCCNAGDIASSLCTANSLAEHGIPVRRVNHYEGAATVIGGGDLFGGDFKDCYYGITGRNLLNAVGVREKITERDFLKDYEYVSVRDYVSAERLGVAGVDVVPCPATLISPLPKGMTEKVPRCGLLAKIDSYIVIHARSELYGFANGFRGSRKEVIAIEPAPYTWTPWEAKGWRLPMTHSPEFIASVVSRAEAVVTLSLHLSIFALAMGTPFCIPTRGNESQQEKLKNYWDRAGFPEVIYGGRHPVEHAKSLKSKMVKVAQREKDLCHAHLKKLAGAAQQVLKAH